MAVQHLSPIGSTFHSIALPLEADMLDALMFVAWGAGVASFLLVADMIKTDLICRRAERVATRRQ